MLETSLVVIIISTLGMLSPGPDFFLVVKNAIRYQRSAAMMTVAGLIAAITCHMAYCVAGLAIVITTTPWLFNLMKYAGAAYLIWIGINSLLSRGGNSILLDNQPRQIITFKKAFMQGFLCNLLNPKATLFFLAIFTQFLNINSGVSEKLCYASIIWGLSVIYWPLLVILIQSTPVRRRLAKAQKIIDKLLGIVLIGLGVKVALG
ncbi:LysE family translocator [Photorhabdus bodei]|uniref:LysE family transporter n=1 Tax=Photorhabdus bodei TaxID=2029681 RepID=A0A329X9B8_9GAMM|nr:LysE family transporter [Photorhabdus bodei]NDL00472.1 LysE family transporter [Photorhabdus bodei]NDL04606.1 LysE family transporter [Photorhabdus bodei]NDL08931.1 LysE family transporter [Photorhabdus bodei]RAX13221.1 lysine transporter LysE [Photorhabdus bodei]